MTYAWLAHDYRQQKYSWEYNLQPEKSLKPCTSYWTLMWRSLAHSKLWTNLHTWDTEQHYKNHVHDRLTSQIPIIHPQTQTFIKGTISIRSERDIVNSSMEWAMLDHRMIVKGQKSWSWNIQSQRRNKSHRWGLITNTRSKSTINC